MRVMNQKKLQFLSDYIKNAMPRVHTHGSDIFLSFEYMKRIPAAYMILAGIRTGKITEKTVIIESSSGTLAIGLAEVCKLLGLECHIVTDPAINGTPEFFCHLLGAVIHKLDVPDEKGNFQQRRLKEVDRLRNDIRDHFYTNQYDNLDNRISYCQVAAHILQQIDGPIDFLVSPVGSGGSSSGLLDSLRLIFPNIFGVAIDTQGSVLFGDENYERKLRGLGNSLIPHNLNSSAFQRVYWVTQDDAILGCQRLYTEHNIFAGLSSGAAFKAHEHLRQEHAHSTIMSVMPDTGYRYLETIDKEQLISSAVPLKIKSPINLNRNNPAFTYMEL